MSHSEALSHSTYFDTIKIFKQSYVEVSALISFVLFVDATQCDGQISLWYFIGSGIGGIW